MTTLSPISTLSYDDLAAVATVGLGGSPFQVTGLSGPAAPYAGLLDRDDPAAAVLDAAALLTAASRAGVLPRAVSGHAGPALTDPALTDTAPELSARAAGVLRRARESDPALLAELLTLAAGRGYRAPAPMLPALLDAAVRDKMLRPAVAGVLGARGEWLAGQRPGWRQVAGLVDPGLPPLAAADDARVWETGSRDERRSYLIGLRDRDPGAARDLLAGSWASQTGEDRGDLLAVLARHLSPADEEFLEQVLDDRKESVRASARRLLQSLPDSALLRRAAERAAPLLELVQRGSDRWLVASLPQGADAAAIRDGIPAAPPRHSQAGPWQPDQVRRWLLIQMIAAAPMEEWVTRFGLDAGQIVPLPLPGGLGAEVHVGWRIAAVGQRRPDWAEALRAAGQPLMGSDQPPAECPDDSELAALLPAPARVARAAAALSAQTVPSVVSVAEIAGLPRPWPRSLADAVIAAEERAITAAARPGTAATLRWTEELAAVAGLGLPATGPTDYAAGLERLAAASTRTPTCSAALHRAAGAISLRRIFTEEIR